jgi:segregation and condensation protein B
MENMGRTKSIIEALLIVSESGLTKEQLKGAINDADPGEVEQGIRALIEDYNSPERGFNIAEIAGRYRIVTKPEFMPWINNMYQKDVDRLTGPSLETLAIIAYKQPATRAEIEAIRGVNVGGVIKTLLEKDLIAIKGRKEVIGRPLMYATTQKFLEIFGLNSLEDLPGLRDFSEEDLDFGKPQETVETTEDPIADSPDPGEESGDAVSDGRPETGNETKEASEAEGPQTAVHSAHPTVDDGQWTNEEEPDNETERSQ